MVERMRIAILGTRGIPANYGGFETFAEELSKRLVERGHEVTVYCRERHSQPTFLGVKLVYLPAIHHKYLETVAHTCIAMFHLLLHPVDVALYCNAANAIFCLLPRVAGIKVALNVDGLERNRKKWNKLAKFWYKLSEWLATFLPNEVVTDAAAIEKYYLERYNCKSTFISYGAEMGKLSTGAVLPKLGLERGEYFLYVSRMEPENNGLLVREAFERVATKKKLALVGSAPYADEYIHQVKDTTDPRVVLPGAIYGQGYKELGSHCFAYIHATEVGGTHPALIEAMGRGAVVLYLNTIENEEVAGDAGIRFEPESLTQMIERVLAMTDAEREALSRAAAARVHERYSWDAVTSEYESLFTRMLG